MRTRIIVSGVGLVVALVLALTWLRLRAETRALAHEREELARSDRALEREQAAFARRVVDLQRDVAERKRVVLASRSAADRARANVGAFVARLKAEHVGRAPVVRPPAPPMTTGGGRFFPELMGDPEYNALYARSMRSSVEFLAGRTLRKLGVPEAVVAQAIELLVEQQASFRDLQSLNASSPVSPSGKEFSKMWDQLRRETGAQLQALLGDEAYARYQDETEGAGSQVRHATEALERRLSYSAEPLSAAQRAQLQAYEAAQDHGSRAFFEKQAQIYREARQTGTIPVDEAKAAFYRSVLTPGQVAAMEELHRESEASLQRSLLPRSPEGK